MKSIPTYSRWLLSFMLIAMWSWTAFAQSSGAFDYTQLSEEQIVQMKMAEERNHGPSSDAVAVPNEGTRSASAITTFPFVETFEVASTTRADWTQIQEAGAGSWTFATGSSGGTVTTAYEGTLNARFVSSSGSSTPITKLVSPVIDFTGYVSASLNFFYAQEDWWGDQNITNVYYRISDTDPWVQLASYPFNVSSWTEITIDLPNLSDTYQVAFEGVNNWGRANVVDLVTVDASMAPPGLQIVNATLDMGDRPIGAWMKPAAFEIVNNPGAGDFEITEADIDDNFGGYLQVVTPQLPYTLASGETTFDFGVTNGEAPVADGPFSGSFAMFFGSRAVLTADYSGNAYTPVAGDVWEMAFDANAVTFPDNVAMGSFVDNYDLPGATDDGWDVVYMIDIDAGDVVVDVSLTGTDAKMALYPADFEGVGGPDMDNELYSATTSATGLELFEGVYYLVVSTTGADFTLDITDMVMPDPDAVTNVAPIDGATGIINGDDLEWAFGANTLEYQLILGTTYPPATVVVDWTADLAEMYTLTNTQPNLQYFWQVNVRNNNGTTNGPIWGFTTAITPPADLEATVNDPGESSTTVSATLEWTSPLNRALIGYNIYRDAIKINTDPVIGETFTDLGLARNTTFAYYVTAVFDEGESPASNTENVTTKGVGTADGVVYDFLSGDPIEGASVRVQGPEGTYVMTTNADGEYSTLAYAGTYDVNVTADGYTSQNLVGIVVAHSTTTSNDFYMMEVPLPVGEVTAFELSEDAVQISWDGSGPEPPQPVTFRYDDGVRVAQLGSGTGTLNTVLGSAHAVDATLQELSWMLSDAPTGGGPHATIQLYILGLNEDGTPDGSNVLYTESVTNVDGVWNTHVLPAPIEATGGFFIGAAYNGFLGIGTDDGVGEPYEFVPGTQFFTGDYTSGAFSDIGDFGFEVNYMIRAYGVENAVLSFAAPEAPQGKIGTGDLTMIRNYPTFVPHPVWKTKTENSGTADRGIIDYTVWREKVYQPEALVEVGNTSQQNFVDFDWEIMEWGVYRWAVTVNYEAGQTSAPAYSNTLDKNMLTMVDVAVTLNSGEAPGGTTVTFTNTSEPALELVYETTLDNSGLFAWDEFRRGVYDIEVAKLGYGTITETGVEIFDESSFEWLLEEILAAPAGLYVTPTAFATWEGGTGGGFEEYFSDFEADNGGWESGSIAGTDIWGWGVPANGDLDHAFSGTNVWATGLTANYSSNQNIYLMRQFDFSAAVNPYISMQLLLQTENNWDGMIMEYSIDDGTTWTKLEGEDFYNNTSSFGPLAPPKWSGDSDTEYQLFEAMMPDLAGLPNVWLRFRFQSDGSVTREGVAIDDVLVGDMTRSAASVKSFDTYKVFLDGQLVAETADSEYQFDVATLTPYETYTAGVAAVFTTGQSTTTEKDFIYVPCGDYGAPTAFAAAQVEGTLDIMLEWTNVDAAALDTISALRIYRNGEEYVELDFTTEVVDMFLDEDLEFGLYTYCVTYIYDSGAETCQGVTCSDEIEIDGNAGVDGMVMQAAYLGGDPIEGASVMLVNVDDPDMTFEFFTDATGAYEGSVIAGTYDYTVSAMGYTSEMLEDVAIALNATVTNDFELMEFPYPPILVVAEEITDDNVLITWHNPFFAPFEPIMETFDSGIPADWTVEDGGSTADTWEGVASYSGSTLDGTPMAFVDSDGAGIGPVLDEMLYTPVINAATVETLYLTFDQYYRHLGTGSYGAVDVYDGTDWVTVLNQTATAGAWNNPNQQSIDVSAYANEEFQVRFHYFDNGSWAWYWAVDNVAITDEVTRSGAPVLSNTEAPERELFGYEVWRTTCETGDLEFLGLTLDTLFNDNTWGSVEAGVYKWGVVAVYDEDNNSEVVFSNCLDKDMVTTVSVDVSTNSGDLPDGTNVMFTNTSEPDLGLVYEVTLDETGYFMWEEFRKGVYDIYVEKNGFNPIEIVDYLIDGPEAFVWTLEELLLPVSDLYVTPTGFATWSSGGVIPFEPFMDDFSEGIDNWTATPATGNWQLSQTNLAGGETPEVRFYWSPNTLNRFYFTSPMMSTLTQTEIELSFDHFVDHFSGAYTISVVTIADGEEYLVEEWNPSADIPANNFVTTLTSDHGVGAEEFQIAFVFDGQAWNVNWWNIDNVMLYTPGTRELEYYKVWHEGTFITDTEETYYQYDIEGLGLVEGEEYLAEVAAVYSNGMSPKMSYLWTYYGCENFPGPENLAGSASGQDVTLTWGAAPPPPPPGGDAIEEDFEGGSLPADWMVEQTNTATGGATPSYWTVNDYISADFTPFGTYHAGLWWDYGHQDEWLITPEFNVPADAELSFWSVVYQGSTYLDHYYVKISTDGGSTWTVLWDASTLSGGWNYYDFPYDVDLSSYAGQDVHLAFQAIDGDNAGLWYIFFVDNIVVSSASRTLAFDTESLIRKSNSANRDMYARDGNNTAVARQLNSETDADADIRTVEMSREMWDLLYDFDMDTPSGLTGLAGAESDGEFIYATKWAGGEIVKFDMDGNFIETFTIPGVTGLRDLAFDGTYMYGAAAATTVYKMDFNTQTLVSSFTAPTAVRAIAYDADNDAFWGNNWSTDMVLFDETGATLNSLSGMPSMYGAAYDNFSDGGPFLWFFTGTVTGGGCQVEQYDIAAGAMTGVSHSVSTDLGDVIAGGLYIVEDLVTDKVILGGTAQGTPDLAFGYELIDNAGGGGGGGGGNFDPGELLGANVYRDGMLIAEMVTDTFYVDMDVEYGMYTYCVTYVYESGAESCFETCVDVEVAFPCDAPKELYGAYLWTEEAWGSMLEWNSPQEAIAEWLYYDDGTNVDGIGGPASFTWAIKFDPAQLADYDGASLTKIEIYNRTGATDELRIYEGTNAATLLHSQPLSGLGIEVYEQVELTDAVLIDVTKELWIAVYTTDGVNYPAGCGPTQNEPNGDLITLDGVLWEHLSDFALPYTWNLRGFVTTMAGATAALPMDKPVDDYSNNTEPLKVTGKPSAQFAAPASAAQADRELDVFNVYRSLDNENYELLSTVPFEEGVLAYSYFDTDVEAQTDYYYQVTAFYTYTNGTCESDPAMALENPEDDFVLVFVTNTNEFGLNNTRVYPNPATNNVVIESAQMNRITVMNAVGQVVIDRGIEGEQRHDLNTSTYEAGVYMIRIETTEGVVTKRLTIVR
ncbi:MAG: carboxypeptidase regulatory-like domain-containing protein [Bacteroidetes bacterium]|nr:carboxypeptidase regulatory-like domain-containing protein [Bacteroidota bacterium]MBU1580267.1 carboxypeptidase regulatory-like domain-containing protein [Bacteroidota bacterium]